MTPENEGVALVETGSKTSPPREPAVVLGVPDEEPDPDGVPVPGTDPDPNPVADPDPGTAQ